MKLGFGELFIIFVVILFIVGPDKIPSFAKKIGEGLKAFRNATSDVTKELKENVVDPLNEASAPIREAMEPIAEMKKDIDRSVTDLKRDMTSLNSVTRTPVQNSAQVTESEPEGEGAEPPAPRKPMKTAHVYDSSLDEDYSPLVPKASAKPRTQPEPEARPEPETPAEPTAPAEAAPEQE